MAKPTSTRSPLLGRFVKGLVGLLLIPPVIGVALGIDQELASLTVWTYPAAHWMRWGAVGYVGVHVLFEKPAALFRFSHALLARVAVWLFGGQVATVGSESSKGETAPSKTKGKSPRASAQGSTLVVLSPYLVPFYAILLSGVAWLVGSWVSVEWLRGLLVLAIGASLAFHIAMTAEDLQEDRARFPVERHLVALALSSLVSLLLAGACLPLAVPGFSLLHALAQAATTAQGIYTAVANTLFL